MRIGLFGGSFDPIHEGHLAIARGARDAGRCERVLVMVARVPPHKATTAATAEDRLAMARLAVAGERGLEVSDLELRREGPSYTIDTVRELKRADARAEIALVVGSDSLPELPKWRDARALLAETVPLVAPRRGVGREVLERLRPALGDDAVERLSRGWLDLPLRDVSATDVRRRVAAGEPIEGLVPRPVAEYVRDHGLYRA